MIGHRCRRRWPAALFSWSLLAVLLAAPLTSAAAAPSIQEIYRRAAPSVVFITQVDAAGKTTSVASGFIVAPNGVVVTNYHVIEPDPGAVQLRVKVPSGDVYSEVRVIYAEQRRDFAVISLRATGLPALPVGDSDRVEVGDQILAIGNPQGLELTLTQGIVESLRTTEQYGYRFIQHQAPISPGSSGGPLLNMNGEAIGINAFRLRDAQNIAGAIPINYVKPFFGESPKLTWEEWARTAAGGAPPRPAPATPAQPAPGTVWAPNSFFEHVGDFRTSADPFRLGFAAGMFDAVSMFAAAAQGAGLSSPAALGLFRCLDEKGDRLGELNTWLTDAAEGAADATPVVSVVVRACQRAFAPGSFFAHVVDFKRNGDQYRLGFSAGVYDAVSLFATAAQDTGGIDTRRTIGLFRCLDGKGDALVDLATWVTGAARGGADRDSAVSVVVRACEQ